jgi:hypothetical protein
MGVADLSDTLVNGQHKSEESGNIMLLGIKGRK